MTLTLTLVSVAQASRRLGIDAKTLHRWLAEAQLPLLRHPDDGRKKGISREQLHLLARLHQRRLALLEEELPAPLPAEMPELPAALLALPERLGVLQAQLTVLQQHVADLTRLLTQREPGPTLPQAPTVPSRALKRPSPPTSSAPRARPAAKPSRQPVHIIPRVEYGSQGHYVVICPTHGLLPFEPDTPAWFAWVAQQDSFRFVGKGGHFTAHHEGRVPRGAWRAHRHIRHHVYIQRLAPNQALTIAVLEQAALALQAHLT